MMINEKIQLLNTKIFNQNVENMSSGSHQIVSCTCPSCKILHSKEYRSINKQNNTLCGKCGYKIRGYIKKHHSLSGKTIQDYKFNELLEDNIVKIECVVCSNVKQVTISGFKKGISHKMCGKDLDMYDTRFYGIWSNMRTRTTNINYEKWDKYGGKGISSECWKYFKDFYTDMYESYMLHVEEYGEADTTLDRINNSSNYCLDNCRWATRIEQAGNKTNANVCLITSNGVEKIYKNLKQYCLENNISYSVIITGLKKTNNEYYHKRSKTNFKRINQTTIENTP